MGGNIPNPSLSTSNKQEPDSFRANGTAPSKDVAWYQDTLSQVPDVANEILKKYSGIPEDKILEHIYEVRDKAWDIHPYPCNGLFKFIEFTAYQNRVYPEVVERVRAGEKFLDLGCSLGQDIRKLVHDGAPAENVFGADGEGRFIDLGYELFRDRETLKARFYEQDFFDDTFLPELHDQIDIIFLGNILHLFGFEKQKVIMAQLLKVLRKRKGSLVFGVHLGAVEGGVYRNEVCGWDLYHHSQKTIEELFAVHESGEWAVESQLHGYAVKGWEGNAKPWQGGDENKLMRFVARRL